jgi:hypothetical protein
MNLLPNTSVCFNWMSSKKSSAVSPRLLSHLLEQASAAEAGHMGVDEEEADPLVFRLRRHDD